MRVFISWSGEQSRAVAEAIRDWLPGVLQSVVPYFTPTDIEKGTRWSSDIAQELEQAQVGVLCITRENISSDWILFEAGALSKSLDKGHVCPILFGITPTDLSGPLKQFQATEFSKPDFHKLIGVINSGLGDRRLPPKTLDAVFEKWWPDLENRVSEILNAIAAPTEPVRRDRELIEEILSLVRATSLRTPTEHLNPRAIEDLLERFIVLHDDQAQAESGYQDVLDQLKEMSRSIAHIAKRFAERNPAVAKSLERIHALSFRVAKKNSSSDDEDDELPF